MRDLITVADAYLVATGLNGPHLKALQRAVEEALKKEGERAYRKSGSPDSGWVVLDYVDVVIHLFSAEARAYYNLEQLWRDAQPIDLDPAPPAAAS